MVGKMEHTHPASCGSRLVEEDENKGSPDCGEEADQTEDESQHHTLGNEIAKSLILEEPWVGIALHGLKHIVFRRIKQLRICTLLWSFDGILNLIENTLGYENFSFRSW